MAIACELVSIFLHGLDFNEFPLCARMRTFTKYIGIITFVSVISFDGKLGHILEILCRINRLLLLLNVNKFDGNRTPILNKESSSSFSHESNFTCIENEQKSLPRITKLLEMRHSQSPSPALSRRSYRVSSFQLHFLCNRLSPSTFQVGASEGRDAGLEISQEWYKLY